MRMLFTNARMVLPPGEPEYRGSLLVEEGIIREIIPTGGFATVKSSTGDDFPRVDCQGGFLSAGLIDLHCHGALGLDTMDATPESFRAILHYHARRGATQVVLTTISASLASMLAVLDTAENFTNDDDMARLAGIHLEGPYFSPGRNGAHHPEALRHPTEAETSDLLKYQKVITRMTLAPELPGAIDLVKELVHRGIAVSAGHSNADEEESLAGFDAGVRQVTHLYNCMSSLHQLNGKRLTGLAEAALTTRGVLCEVIADGRHLSRTLLRLAWMAKGWSEVMIVSDATAGAGLPEGSAFDLGGCSCRIEGGAAWTGTGAERRLAGSTSGMIDGVRTMVEVAGIPLAEAVAMATIVPARALGQEKITGSMEVGKKADLLLFSENWEVSGVWSAGNRIV